MGLLFAAVIKAKSSDRRMQEQQQTIEFYKIQLMEKDREIADFEAKMRIVNFRHTRELKELKVAKERFEALLNEEKSKADKISKQVQEQADQNKMLQQRFSELKKELADVQNKYNLLKDEVRAYERILPTYTFLKELQLTISELPNYQDLFINLRQTTSNLAELKAELEQTITKGEQEVKALLANEQNLKMQKCEAEKTLKQILGKMLEAEHVICDLRIHNEDLGQKNEYLLEELELSGERCESLEESIKEYEEKMERLAIEFEQDFNCKEEEIYRIQKMQIMQMEEELQSQQLQFQRKEAAFNEQIRFLEQQNIFLTNKYQTEIENFEEHYLLLKEEIEKMRAEISQEKLRYDDLSQRYKQSTANLSKSSIVIKQIEERNRVLSDKIHQYERLVESLSRQQREGEGDELKELQEKYQELLEQFRIVSEEYKEIQDEKFSLQEENYHLREELSASQLHSNRSNPSFLELPKPSHESKTRKKSTQISAIYTASLYNVPTRDRKPSTSAISQTYQQNKVNQSLHQQEVTNAILDFKILQDQLLKVKGQVEVHINDKEAQSRQIIQLKQKLLIHSKNSNQLQKSVFSLTMKLNMQKTRSEAFEEQVKMLQEQLKKQREQIRKYKQQSKSTKQVNSSSIEKYARQAKQLQSTVEQLKQQKEKLRMELFSKEKAIANEHSLLLSSRDHQQRLKQQIADLNSEITCKQSLISKSQQTQQSLHEEIKEMKKENEAFANAIKKLERENELANYSLERERKQRSLLTVPSLQSISAEDGSQDAFNEIYCKISQKEAQITLLKRDISNLREEAQTQRLTFQAKSDEFMAENSSYVQTIIQMKMRCAESEMRASEKQFLYNQLKRKAAMVSIAFR